MTKYLIKETILEGEHKGKTFLLDKQGYVREDNGCFFDSETYALTACKATCTRKYKTNCLNIEIEKRQNEYRISKGKEPLKTIYYLASYEPYAVESKEQ